MKTIAFLALVAALVALACASASPVKIAAPRNVDAISGSLICGEILKHAKSARIKGLVVSSSSAPKDNTTLIIALCCGIGGALLIGAIIAAIVLGVKHKKKGKKDVSMSSVGSGAAPVYDS